MPASAANPGKDVFINCPFDPGYKDIFDAIVFAVVALGYDPRCALEADDSGEVRKQKIERIIRECPYGIHDISNVELDKTTNLPRFNMPFELGLFLGCKEFGTRRQREKKCVILDLEKHRYQKFISDIAGQDIRAHNGDPRRAIVDIRDWLTTATGTKGIMGGSEIVARYELFLKSLPGMCKTLKRERDSLTFNDLKETIELWLDASV